MPTDETDHDTRVRRALGRVIAMRRAELGLKRNDIRDRSGLSYPYVAELENGVKTPSSSALTAIADALELRPSELLERAEAMAEGEDLLRSAPREEQGRWFHANAPVGAAAAMSAPVPPRRRRSQPIDPDLREAIEKIVREVVRDELRRAGVVGPPSRRRGRE